MTTLSKKFLAMLLAVLMTVAMLAVAVPALAEGTGDDEVPEEGGDIEEEVPPDENIPDEDVPDENPDVPQTGDAAVSAAVVAAAAVVAVAAGAVVVKKVRS